MNFRMATNQASISMKKQGTINPTINQNQQPVVGRQTDPQTFPFRRLKMFGGIQIGCGILGGILCIIGVVLDAILMNEHCKESNDRYTYAMCLRKQSNRSLLLGYDITCIICSAWVSFEMSLEN